MPSKRIGRKIEAIVPTKKGHYLVLIGGTKLLLSEDAFTENPLYVGKVLSEAEYKELLGFLKREKGMDYAMRLVGQKAYSTKEIRDKLRLKEVDEEEIRQIIFYLKKNGFLDDRQYAEDYAESKGNLLYGKERIIETLRYEKGIKDEDLASLKFTEEKAHAAAFLKTLERKTAKMPLRSKREKISAILSRRGFDQETIKEALSSLREDKKAVSHSLEDEANKAIKRYQRKYNGYELKQKCFAYLYGKGYPSNEISELLEDKLDAKHY